jgi:methionine-rich copper-binding protein CopC
MVITCFRNTLMSARRGITVRSLLSVGTIVCMGLGTSSAIAHAALESSIPAANSTVSPPTLIQVRFSEALEMKLSSLKLSSSDGIVIAVKPMNDAGKPATLSVRPTTALKAGQYTVTWSVVAEDSHHTHGSFSFMVQ